MKATVMGSGAMGTPIAYALCELGFDVTIIDSYEPTLQSARKKLASLGHDVKANLCLTPVEMVTFWEKPDIVVSAVPWKFTLEVAKLCVDHNVRYCDLGGNPDVSQEIQSHAESGNACVFTDLGLAPGWANIIAEKGFKTKGKAEKVQIFVGGLPVVPTGPFKYNCVFSIDGLVNEYLGDCEVLKDGEIVKVKALSDIQSHNSDTALYETAHTKGALSKTLTLMKARGVKECFYKTLRYVGHFEKIRYLIDECKLHEVSYGYKQNALEQVLSLACPKTTEDKVLIDVRVDDWDYSRCIFHNEDWTAMQMATAFPTAAIASIMATGMLDGKKVLDYSDVPFGLFDSTLNKLDFKV